MLKRAVGLVEELEEKELRADQDLVAVSQDHFGNRAAVDKRAVGRLQIANLENSFTRSLIDLCGDRGMKTRCFSVVHANVRLYCATERDLRLFERNGHRE